MKKTRFLSLALTGTLCVSLLAGCGGSGDGGGAAQTPDAANTSAVQENTGSAFKLGGTGPLTGDAAIYGLAAQRGAQIAVDEIKEAGGDIQFALKYEDDVNVPETAVNAYNALKSGACRSPWAPSPPSPASAPPPWPLRTASLP